VVCVGVAGLEVLNTKICGGFLPNGVLSCGRRQYCGFLLRDLRVISLINIWAPISSTAGGVPNIYVLHCLYE